MCKGRQKGREGLPVRAVLLLLIGMLWGQGAAAATAPGILCFMNEYPSEDHFYLGNLEVRMDCTGVSDAVCLIVAQERDGELLQCAAGQRGTDGSTVAARLEITEIKDTLVKVMVWESLESLRPVCEPLVLRPGDGKAPGQRIYCSAGFDSPEEPGVSIVTKQNAALLQDGWAELVKTRTDDIYIDMNLTDASSKVVLEADFRHEGNPPGNSSLFYLRDAVSGAGTVNTGVGRFQNGSISVGGKTIVLSAGVWTRLSMALDTEKHCFDFYVNGQRVISREPVRADLCQLSLWRIYVGGGEDYGSLKADNIRIYDGACPRDVTGHPVSEFSIFSDVPAKGLLAGRTALQPYADVIFAEGKKQKTDLPCIIADDEVLVSPATMEKLYGEPVTVSGDTVLVGDKAVFTIGKKELQTGGRTFAIESAPRLAEGVARIPARAYGIHVLPEGSFCDDQHGLLLVGGNIDPGDARMKEANLYLFFERKSPEELKAMLAENLAGDMTAHPRIMADAETFEHLRQEAATDPCKSSWFEIIKKRADSLLTKQPQEYKIVNSRLLDVANEAISRTGALGMAWQLTGDRVYAERCLAEIEKYCAYPDWHPAHCLDTGTMALAVAVGYDWIYETIPEERRQSLMERAKNLGLEPARAAYYGKAAFNAFWTKTETNWGAVVNAGFLNLALAIAELEPDYMMDTAACALRSMEYPIYRIAPDGAWYEGPGYWSYFFRTLCYGLAGYESAMGKLHEALRFKGADGLSRYQAYFSDPMGMVNNFHDGGSGATDCEGKAYLGSRLGQTAMMESRAEFLRKNPGLVTVCDLLWYEPAAGGQPGQTPPLDGYFRETEFVSMRQNWEDADALWVSAHGGRNNNAHDHIDDGSFVFTLGGVRWAADLGSEPLSYVDDSINPAIQAGFNSYYFYRRKGEGHNIVVINPDENLEMAQGGFAQVSPPVSGANRAYAHIDLSQHYRGKALSYIRGYLLSEGRRAFTVRDEIELFEPNSELYWFMHTKGDIAILDNSTALIAQDGKTLKVQFLTSAAESELMVMEAKKLPQSPQFRETANNGITKLTLKLKASGRVNITAKMSLADEAPSQTPPETTPIAQWTVD